LTIIYGLAAAGAAVAFQLAISWFYSSTLVPLARQPLWVFMAGSFIVITSTSLVSGYLLSSFCKEARAAAFPNSNWLFGRTLGGCRSAWFG